LGIRPPSSCHQLSLAAQFSKASTAGPLRRPPGSQHSLQQLDDSLALHRQQLFGHPASRCAGRRPASLCRTPRARSGVPPSIVTRSRSRSAMAPRSRRSRAPWRFGRSRPTKACGARRAENPHAAGPQRQSEQGRTSAPAIRLQQRNLCNRDLRPRRSAGAGGEQRPGVVAAVGEPAADGHDGGCRQAAVRGFAPLPVTRSTAAPCWVSRSATLRVRASPIRRPQSSRTATRARVRGWPAVASQSRRAWAVSSAPVSASSRCSLGTWCGTGGVSARPSAAA